jgi:hypothetical protein
MMDTYIEIAEAIKADVADILALVLAGTEPRYMCDVGPRSYIRWGVVQKDIDRAIDYQLTASDELTKTHAHQKTPSITN